MSISAKQSTGIEISGVTKTYGRPPAGVLALDTCDLSIAPGEFLAIVGPSGCGKSTLLRLVAGLIPVSTGSICVSGTAVAGPLRDVGIVFQQPILLDWLTILGNVLFQIDMRGLNVEEDCDDTDSPTSKKRIKY